MAKVYLENLITNKKRSLSDRLSSRMVSCAAVLHEGSELGWQMIVPKEGLVSMTLYGSEEVSKSDLEWIVEKVGHPSKRSPAKKKLTGMSKLYELSLPVAQATKKRGSIGFGSSPEKTNASDSLWPTHYSTQFEELIRALQQTGAVFHAVFGPASEAEKELCRKNTLRTYREKNIDVTTYLGHPVKARFFLRLPGTPSVRLKTILEEAIPGIELHYLGNINEPEVKALWETPLDGAIVYPDYAARILLMEPDLEESIVGIEVCEEDSKPIPASHKNPDDPLAVTIGEAISTTGGKTKITLADVDLKRHYQIIGQTGTGKSSLLVGLIRSAIETDHGLTFFDPHGSTIDIVLRTLPKKYANRVRVVRVGDAEHPVPLNIWDSDDPGKEERNINDLCELFADIFDPERKGIVGPRYERWLSTFAKASIALLGNRASLESITILSQSRINMRKVYDAIRDEYPEIASTIQEEYGRDNSQNFNSDLSWYLSKFQRITSVEQLRKTLGAGTNALDFAHSIDTPTVNLIDLASPVIGTHAARIVGTLTLMKLWNAAMSREHRERNHLVIVDEASLFQTNPMPRMLAEGRKFGISMILCHQHAGQLTPEIRDALEANSANFSAFRVSPRDAATAAVRLDNPDFQQELSRLDAFNAITTLSVEGKQTAPFTMEIPKPKHMKNGDQIAEEIEKHSIETLVEPNHYIKALTSREIQTLLDIKAGNP